MRQTPDGRTIDLEVMVSPISDPAGTNIGGLATARDVTRQNALQEQIRQAQKMEALGTLAGGITHDFNNILGTIVINTELALLDLDPSDPARRPLPVVLQAANRGKELVKQIITFSRQRAWERKPVEITPVVREGLGLLRSTLPKDVVLRETIDEASGVVLADPSHIHQILVNLCQNAALAMRDCDERELEVGLEPVEADAAMAVRNPDLQPGPYVRLTVADTGCGMRPEVVERIFEPFFTTRERGSGSGLGLSVVHGIVKSYGGAITVRSRPGQGSVFAVYLPRLGEDVLAVGSEPAAQPVRGQARILVVEDEEAQRTSLTRGLERLGYGVTAEPEGRSALAAFRKDPGAFDLVISDQIMPRMSGLELAAELMKVRPDVPVILSTGFSEKVDDGTIGTSGIRELVMKPFSITEISQLVRKVLEKDNRSASSASRGPSLKKPGRRAARPFKVRP
jgi:signal transduction histidine kinase/ActR/RegA family two-component response regulator